LLTLAIWKYRGLGELAAAPAPGVRTAAGLDSLLNRVHNSQTNSWGHLHNVLLALREHFWISRVIEWIPVAGAIGFLLRSRRGFLLVVTWFATYLLIKGTYIPASVDDTSFFRIVMPGFPAFVLLCAGVVLLVPGLRARPAVAPTQLRGRKLTAALVAGAVAFGVAPLAVVAAVPPIHDGGRTALRVNSSEVPVSSAPSVTATAGEDAVRLRWRSQRSGATGVFYDVLRRKEPNRSFFCGGRLNGSADQCQLVMDTVATTHATSYVDHPGKGTWTYRIGVSANWLDDVKLGDVYVVSPTVTVTVR
jgi:hypothetical protein